MAVTEKFSDPLIREQLNRILSTPAFNNSRILSDFLAFIVKETLAGKEQEIKEYTIGVNVLSRSSNFNPQFDAIVRTHAGRLRRALKEYYADLGRKDPIQIEIPKGAYIPIFLPQIESENAATIVEKTRPSRNRPTIAVLPFRNISKDSSREFFADGLGEQLSTELSWFQDLCVISYFSSRNVISKANDVKEVGRRLGAKYILTGSIQSDEQHLRVWVQLILCESGEQLWTKSFEENNTGAGLFEIQTEIVQNILKAIGGYYGVIFRNVLNAPQNNQANDLEIYDAIFWYHHYQKVFTKEAFQKAITALEAAVKADPEYALAWATLGELYMDDKACEFTSMENPIEQGLKCVARAILIDPNCQHAYQALAWGNLFLHDKEAALNAIERCISINPNSTDKVGAMGFGLICAGEFDRGYNLLQNSLAHNPFGPWWYQLGFIFYHLYKKEYQQGLQYADKINMPDLYWDPMMKGCTLGHLNRSEEAEKQIKLLVQHLPTDTAEQVKNIISSFVLSQDAINEVMEGLRKSGLKGVKKSFSIGIAK